MSGSGPSYSSLPATLRRLADEAVQSSAVPPTPAFVAELTYCLRRAAVELERPTTSDPELLTAPAPPALGDFMRAALAGLCAQEKHDMPSGYADRALAIARECVKVFEKEP